MAYRHRPIRCSGEEWDKARMRALVRDAFRCQWPGCDETRLRMLQVHHIVQRSQGGTHDLDNLITYCREHHAAEHPHLSFILAKEQRMLDGPQREL